MDLYTVGIYNLIIGCEWRMEEDNSRSENIKGVNS